MSSFNEAINAEIRKLAELPNTLFIGQSLRYDGAAIYNSLDGVPMNKRIEFPVAEEFQMGYCIGLALSGILPICIYPRIDFMVLAMNQLVNHLDKLPLYGWAPKMIIRTTVGKKTPLDAGPQHTQNHADAFRAMLRHVKVIETTGAATVPIAYAAAIESPCSTIIVENQL